MGSSSVLQEAYNVVACSTTKDHVASKSSNQQQQPATELRIIQYNRIIQQSVPAPWCTLIICPRHQGSFLPKRIDSIAVINHQAELKCAECTDSAGAKICTTCHGFLQFSASLKDGPVRVQMVQVEGAKLKAEALKADEIMEGLGQVVELLSRPGLDVAWCRSWNCSGLVTLKLTALYRWDSLAKPIKAHGTRFETCQKLSRHHHSCRSGCLGFRPSLGTLFGIAMDCQHCSTLVNGGQLWSSVAGLQRSEWGGEGERRWARPVSIASCDNMIRHDTTVPTEAMMIRCQILIIYVYIAAVACWNQFNGQLDGPTMYRSLWGARGTTPKLHTIQGDTAQATDGDRGTEIQQSKTCKKHQKTQRNRSTRYSFCFFFYPLKFTGWGQ